MTNKERVTLNHLLCEVDYMLSQLDAKNKEPESYSWYQKFRKELCYQDVGTCPFCRGECYWDEENERHVTYPLNDKCVCVKFRLED